MWCGYLSKEKDPSGYPHPRPPYLHSAFHTSPGPDDAINLLPNLHFPIFCLSLSDPYFVPILCQTLQQILATNLLSMDLLECAIGGKPSFLSNSCQAMAKTSNQQLTYLVCLICYKSGCFHRTSALYATLSLTQSWHSNYPAIR